MSDEIVLTYEDKRDSANILANLYDFTDGPRTARLFIQETAGLAQFIPGTNWNNTPRTLVSELLEKISRWGYLPDRPSYHALGALFSAVEGLPEVSNENRAYLSRLIIRYGLVRDPQYIAAVQSRYNLADEPSHLYPAPSVTLPDIGSSQSFGPAFDIQPIDSAGLEKIIHSEDNFLDIFLLEGALQASLAVGMVECPQGNPLGTGFLINHNLLLTNQHVLKNKTMLTDAWVRFGYREDANNIRQPGHLIKITSDLYKSSSPEALDYAMVQLAESPLKQEIQAGRHRGYLSLAPRTIYANERVNIIQHPSGAPLKVVLTQNYVILDMSENRVQYVADTQEGSSGSPVMNKLWQVVALHHSGTPYPPDHIALLAQKAWKGVMRVNEGIPIKAILADLKVNQLDRLLPAGM